MFTTEKKVDLVMRYIASADKAQQNELKKLIIKALKEEDGVTEVPAPVSKDSNVEDIINDILKEIGTPPHLIGYKYLLRAVDLVHKDDEYLRAVTKCLYPDIAKEYGTTASRVERAIRHAMETTFDRGDMDNILSVFGNTFSANRGKLTNSEAVAGLANEVARRLRKEG